MIDSTLAISSSNDLNDFLDEYLMLFSFLSYLKTYDLFNNYFTIPFKIKKRESPDFKINDTCGIEICFAIPQSIRYANALSKKASEDSFIELDPKLINTENVNKKEIEKFIKEPDQELSDEIWIGKKMEFDWANKVFEQILFKTYKLNSTYTIFQKNILLINADFLLNRDFETAENFLIQKLNENKLNKQFEINFSEIFIITKLKSMCIYKI